MPERQVILLADDDPDDRALVREALKDSGLPVRLETVRDGVELLEFLADRTADAAAGGLAVILLDLNMPRMSGHEALAAIKRDPRLRSLPVVVFTTSTRQEDIDRVYDAGGNTFISKPSTYDDLVELMRSLSRYWTGTASLPSSAAA